MSVAPLHYYLELSDQEKKMRYVCGVALTVVLMGVIMGMGGCSLFHSHSTIAPPEGCNNCHQKPINSNWHVLFKPATLHGEQASQTPHTVFSGKPVNDSGMQRCFYCHHTPAPGHSDYQGIYRH